VRDAFALAKEKQPAIIFIDEIDAIGTKRFDSELSGDREVQRTMLELLNQLDGFTSNDNVKVGFWGPKGRLVGGRRGGGELDSPAMTTSRWAGVCWGTFCWGGLGYVKVGGWDGWSASI
jgi:hypothetical protein